MSFGTFTVTISGTQIGGTSEDSARLVVTANTGTLKDADGDAFRFPREPKYISLSPPYPLILDTDVTTGSSTVIGYTVTVTTKAGGRITTSFAAQAAGTTIALTDLVETVVNPPTMTAAQYADDKIAANVNTPGSLTSAALTATIDTRVIPKVGGVPQRATITTDEFTGTSLGSLWRVLRPQSSGQRVTGGALQIDTLAGDQYNSADTAKNIVYTPAPEGAWEASVKVTGLPTANGQNFGLGVYVGQSRSLLLMRQGRSATTARQQYLLQANNVRQTTADLIDGPTSSLTASVWMKLSSDGKQITAYQSPDGTTWTQLGRPAPVADVPLGHIALYAYDAVGNTPITITFEHFKLVARTAATAVQPPVVWKSGGAAPSGALVDKTKQVMQNADKYALGTWFPATFGSQGAVTYLAFAGTQEADIRPAASTAYALAASLSTGVYSSTVTGISNSAATATLLTMIRSLAYRHRANTPSGSTNGDGWGTGSQDVMWAAWAAQAAWMMWDSLTDTDKVLVYRMIVSTAEEQLRLPIYYWRDLNGADIYAGDTRSDDDSWCSSPFQIACAMMPSHPHYSAWFRRMTELMVAAWSTPDDLTNNTVVDGRPVSQYLNGYNIYSDGSCVNHNIYPNADYLATQTLVLHAGVTFSLADLPTPASAFRNAGLVYSALSEVNYPSPPYGAPGGTMYTAGSDAIYYPSGNDWGTARRADKAGHDLMVDAFGLAPNVATPAATWADLHVSAVLAQQARGTTGQTYQAGDSDSYPNRESWVAQNIAYGWLARWVVAQGLFRTERQQKTGDVVGDPASDACPLKSGLYYVAPHISTNTMGMTTGTMRGARFTTQRAAMLNSLAVNVTVAGSTGSVVRLGIYEERTPGTATLLLDAGTVDSTTTGAKALAVTQRVKPGVTYWLVAVGQGAPTTNPTVSAMNAAPPQLGDANAATVLGNTLAGLTSGGVTGALPSSITIAGATQVPKVAVRAA